MVNKKSLLGLDMAQLIELTVRFGLPKFTAKQIADWIYKKHVRSIDEMTNISQKARNLISQEYSVGCMPPADKVSSVDGTVKYLFPTESGGFVETVYIPDGDRATLCVSCQVGCKMNCLFCQTGKQGFHGNLTVVDILNQVYSVYNADSLTNIVFMGQGEPFDNLDSVMAAINLLTAEYAYSWSPKRITVSTVGLKKNLKRFIEESDCHLAISMHSPIHEQRMVIMPAEKQFQIKDIVALLKNYDFSHQRRLSFEYIVFKGFNDSLTYAKEIVSLLAGLQCRMNLIRFHKIPGVDLDGVDMQSMVAFRDYLTNHGVFATIRASRGEDIWAACGMLSTASQAASEDA